jgi:glycosyltransferase involved in cell wall biosynthesis
MSSNEILFIHKSNIQKRPPVQSAVLNLSDLGFSITLITSEINEYWEKKLEEKKIKIICITPKKNIGIDIIDKIIYWTKFRFKIRGILKKNRFKLIWIESGDALLAIGKQTLANKKFVIQVQELYDDNPMYQKKLKWFFCNSEINFVPEYNRANIFRVMYKLDKCPEILQNKPYEFKTEFTKTELYSIVPQIKPYIESNKKIILYQGHLSSDRDLTGLIKEIDMLSDEYILVLIGEIHGSILTDYLKLSSKIVSIPYIPSPHHLLLTANAYVGILQYSPVSLNNTFCAPNKIFEFSKFGIPVIGNDIPGLFYQINHHKIGEIYTEKDSFKSKIEMIAKNYDFYSENSIKFYNSVDNKEYIGECLNKIGIIKSNS